ncbi:MAG: hypothetical protein EOL87_04380 [Spartobacteria bacterium]|nr:hypothetical protein [Spartobacteria bacterium]
MNALYNAQEDVAHEKYKEIKHALHRLLTTASAVPDKPIFMGDPIKAALLDEGYQLREYIPPGSLARGLKYAGRRFGELASQDNALTKTMHGDFTVVEETPVIHPSETD